MLNSVPVHVNARVSEGDILEALIEFEEENEDIVPEKMDLDIICEDDCLIAINKPPDTVVHPTVRHFTGTVANGLRHHLLSKGIKTLIRPVSRLDRDTSGVIVFALNPYVQNELIRQMHDNTYQKEYLGIVHGTFTSASGIIDLPIERLPWQHHAPAHLARRSTIRHPVRSYRTICRLRPFEVQAHYRQDPPDQSPLPGGRTSACRRYPIFSARIQKQTHRPYPQTGSPFCPGLLQPPSFRLSCKIESPFTG